MAIRAITFDFWFTLFRDANNAPRTRIRVDAFHRVTGAAEADIEAAMEKVWAEFARHHMEEQRTLTPRDAVWMTAVELGVTLGPHAVSELTDVFATAILEHSPLPIEGAIDAVRAAAGRMPIGIISDSGVSPGSSLRALLDRHEFTNHFSAMAFSDEVEVAKPQPRMFETAARDLGVGVDELLHIGDLEPTDIAGAQAVGAKAALFTGANDRYRDCTKADYVFGDWAEFLAFLPSVA